MIIKTKLKLLIIGLLLSTLAIRVDPIYANNVAILPYNDTLKVQAYSDFYQEKSDDVETESIQIQLLKDHKTNVVYEEKFSGYIIKNGWINLELGLNESNVLKPEFFNSEKNWIKIIINDPNQAVADVIITMNAKEKSLFSKLANETPTGNLFPSITNKNNNIVIINESADSFEYIPTKNFIEQLGITNSEKISRFFTIEPNDNDHVVIITNNNYETITTASLFEMLNLGEISLKGMVPDINGHANQYLQINNTGTHLKFVKDLTSHTDSQIIATANLFRGEPSKENEIFIYDNNINAFVAQPTENLGFITKQEMMLTYNTSTNILSIGNISSVNLSDLMDNQDKQELILTQNQLILTGDDTPITLANHFITQDELNNVRDSLVTSINQIESLIQSINLVMIADNILQVSSGGNTVNLVEYLDNKDEQQLSFDQSTGILSLSNGGEEINLSEVGSMLGSDDQILSYNQATYELSLEDSNPPTINLSNLKDNTDSQVLDLSMQNELLTITLTRLETANSVITLNNFFGNAATANIGTDIQAFSPILNQFANNGILDSQYLENGNYLINQLGLNGQVWMSDGIDAGSWQTVPTLSLTNNELSLGEISSVDLSKYQQEISFQDNVLRISNNGGEIDFNELGKSIGTDAQQIISFNMLGTVLNLKITDGGEKSVDLSPIDTQLSDENISELGYIKTASVDMARADFKAADLELANIIADNILEKNTEQTAFLIENYISADITQNQIIEAAYTAEDTLQRELIETAYTQADSTQRALIETAYISADTTQKIIITDDYAFADDLQELVITQRYISADTKETLEITDAYKLADSNSKDAIKTSIENEDDSLNNKINNLKLNLADHMLTISNEFSSPIDLNAYNQDIALINNILYLSNGGSIDLNEYSASIGTDDQEIIQLELSGSILNLELEDGGGLKTVDLGSLDTQLTSEEISALGFINMTEIDDVIQAFKEADTEIKNRIENEYLQADELVSLNIHTAYQLADEDLSSNLTNDYLDSDISLSINLTSAFQLADIQIRDELTQEYELANEAQEINFAAEYEAADNNLASIILNNYLVADIALSNNITTAFKAADEQLRNRISEEIMSVNNTQANELILAYQNADEVVLSNLSNDYREADTVLSANLISAFQDSDIQVSNALTQAYELANEVQEINITAEYEAADDALMTQITNDFNAADTQIISTITSEYQNADINLSLNMTEAYELANVSQSNEIEQGYLASDQLIKMEFESADTTINNRINNLDIELTDNTLSFEDGVEEIDLSSYIETLQFNELTKILTLVREGNTNIEIDLTEIDTTLNVTTVQSWITNLNYLTPSDLDGIHWDDIQNKPDGLADGQDNYHTEIEFTGWNSDDQISIPGLIVPSLGTQNEETLKYYNAKGEWKSPIIEDEIKDKGFIQHVYRNDILNDNIQNKHISNTIQSDDILDYTIIGNDIANYTIISDDIGPGAITDSEIADNTISKDKISQISWSKIRNFGNINCPTGLTSSSEEPSLVPNTENESGYFLNGNGEWKNTYTDDTGTLTFLKHSHCNTANTPGCFESEHDHGQFLKTNDHANHSFVESDHSHTGYATSCDHTSYALNSHTHTYSNNADYFYNGNGSWVIPTVSSEGGYGEFTIHGQYKARIGTYRNIIHWQGISKIYSWCHGTLWGTCVTIRNQDENNAVAGTIADGSSPWTTFSDERLKTNIKTIENALYKIQNIRGVRYQRKYSQGKLGEVNIGVIAQEIVQYIPEVVDIPKDENEYYGVLYGQITGVLIEALKELSAEKDNDIDTLNKQIESKENSIINEIQTLNQDYEIMYNQIEELMTKLNTLELKK